MIGFPSYIATVQDYKNLLDDNEFQEKALNELQSLRDFDDRTVTVATEPINPEDPDSDWKTEEIENPNPIHRQKGFESWLELVKLNAEYVDESVEDILESYPVEVVKEAIVEMT